MTKKENTKQAAQAQINAQIHHLVTKIDHDPKQTKNYLQLATMLLEQGSFDQAAQLLKQAKGLVPDPEDLDYDLAVCYYMQGEFDQALQLLNQIPNDDLVLYQKALVFLKTGQMQKALAHALTIKQTDERVDELLGDIWLSLGELKQAQTSYETIPRAKRSAKVNFMLGITVFASDRELGEHYLQQAQKQDPQFYQAAQEQYRALLNMVNDAGKNNG